MFFIDRCFEFFHVQKIQLEEANQYLKSLGKGDVIDFSNATVLDGELLMETKAEKPYFFYFLLHLDLFAFGYLI